MTRLLLSLLALTLALTVSAADWPRFRGPNGSGTADGPLPEIDPKSPLWKVALPGGKGVGSPIIVGGKLYLQTATADGKGRSLLCLDAASGKTLWTKEVPGGPPRAKGNPHAKNSLASGTPACDGEQLYCAWWDGAAGQPGRLRPVRERAVAGVARQLCQPARPRVLARGSHGLVFVNVDDDQRAELVAFDAKTGQKKWIADRKHVRACYTTPFVLERPGKPAELVLGTTTAVTSYEPATGKVNWEYPMVWPKGDMPLRVIGHPVYAGGLVVVYSGDGGGARYMAGIDPETKTPAKVWELKKDTPYVPCVLVKGDRLFWIGDKGIATFAEARTGKAVWSERVFNSDVSASPILVGDKVLMVSEKGEVAVVTADKEYEEPTKVSLGEGVFATPAAADGRVYIRGVNTLFCFGKK
jgi:outer membrane protein assembly factor BamB